MQQNELITLIARRDNLTGLAKRSASYGLTGIGLMTLALAGSALLFSSQADSAGAAQPPPFRSKIAKIAPELRAQMTGVSWRQGCPVRLSDLRLLTLSYRGFDGRSHTGKLIVNKSAAAKIVSVFRRLYRTNFPIRRMRLIDAYGGSDFRSIEHDNSSAFNCRRATGSSSWSNHAYGLAIDINPIENPYVSSAGTTSHKASRPYLDRSRLRRGMAYKGGALVSAFASIGWSWGGYWSGVRDYQHFSVNGR